MAENWPVKSDYNSKGVIGALAEAKGVWGFYVKMLRKLCSLGRLKVTKKIRSWVGCKHPPCMPDRLKVSSYIWVKQWHS